MFGRNTQGGAILFEPHAPTNDLSGYGRIGAGNYNFRNVEGALNVPIIADTLLLRVAGSLTRRDGYTKNVTAGGRMDNVSNEAWRVTLRFQPSDSFQTDLIYDGKHSDESGTSRIGTFILPGSLAERRGGGAAGVAAYFARQALLGPRRSQQPSLGFSRAKLWGLSSITKVELGKTPVGEITFKNIAGYRHTDVRRVGEYGGFSFPVIGIRADTKNLALTEEAQFIGKSESVNWIAGIFLSRGTTPNVNDLTHAADQSFIFSNPETSPFPAQSFVDALSRTKAVFGQVTVNLDPLVSNLSVTAGARRTWDFRRARSFSLPSDAQNNPVRTCSIPVGAPIDACGVTGSAHFKGTSWNLSLDYKPSDNMLVYLASRRGYRGGLLPNAARGLTVATGPEILNDVEFGVKSSWAAGPDVKGVFNIAAFYGRTKDVQRSFQAIQPPSLSPFALNANAGVSVVKGLEVDGSIRLWDLISISGNYSLTEGKYTKDVPIVPPPGVQLTVNAPLKGSPFLAVPKHMGAITTEITIPGAPAVDRLSFSATLLAQSSFYYLFGFGTAFPLDQQKSASRATLDLGINATNVFDTGIDVNIFVRNATNRTYPNVVSIVPPLGVAGTVYAEPRMAGIFLKKSF